MAYLVGGPPRPNQPRSGCPASTPGSTCRPSRRTPPRAGSRRRPITSQTRILMNHAVYSDTPTLAAVSRSGSASAMQAANSIHAAAGSFERASSPSVPAPKVKKPHPRHNHLWRPPRRGPSSRRRDSRTSGSGQARPPPGELLGYGLPQGLGQPPLLRERHPAHLIYNPVHGASSPVLSRQSHRSGRPLSACTESGSMSMVV